MRSTIGNRGRVDSTTSGTISPSPSRALRSSSRRTTPAPDVFTDSHAGASMSFPLSALPRAAPVKSLRFTGIDSEVQSPLPPSPSSSSSESHSSDMLSNHSPTPSSHTQSNPHKRHHIGDTTVFLVTPFKTPRPRRHSGVHATPHPRVGIQDTDIRRTSPGEDNLFNPWSSNVPTRMNSNSTVLPVSEPSDASRTSHEFQVALATESERLLQYGRQLERTTADVEIERLGRKLEMAKGREEELERSLAARSALIDAGKLAQESLEQQVDQLRLENQM